MDHYRGNETAATPAGIRRLTYAIRERAAAVQSALEAGPTVKDPNTFRSRDPERWERLKAQGAADRQADLKRRGLIK
jgi:hypothetical protein